MRKSPVRDPRELWTDGAPAAREHGGNQPLAVQPVVSGNGGRSLRSGIARLDGVVQTSGLAQRDSGSVPGGRQQPSGTRRADGRHVRAIGGGEPHGGLRFDAPVARDGYAWWYVDALSDDGAHGLTLIAFVGSVFSPYYAWARNAGPADPLEHCALNVALYVGRGGRWAMTERGARRVHRENSHLAIGPSALRWTGECLEISVDEICAPLPRRLRGTVRLHPTWMAEHRYPLDESGRHRWTPFAPCARVEVEFSDPDVRWSGIGYFDSNHGDEPLERAFKQWTWSRSGAPHRSVVLYDVTPRVGEPHSLALDFTVDRPVEHIEPPPSAALPRTGWRLARSTRADAASETRLVQTLEDAPFYSRSVLHTSVHGVRAPAIHESLDLDRFSARWVQCLLPFRMPRVR